MWEDLLEQPGIFIPNVADETDTTYFGDKYSSLTLDLELHSPERIDYVDSSDYSDTSSNTAEGEGLEESNPFLNFSFMNLPNLASLTRDNFARTTPREYTVDIGEPSSEESEESDEETSDDSTATGSSEEDTD